MPELTRPASTHLEYPETSPIQVGIPAILGPERGLGEESDSCRGTFAQGYGSLISADIMQRDHDNIELLGSAP